MRHLFVIFVSFILIPSFPQAARENGKPPNFIVILVDTLRADYLGCYGFQGDITPNIDKLAQESVKFTRCVAPSPWTKPSIASLFTSLHPQTHRVTDHLGMHWRKVSKKQKSSVLADEAVTMAEVFKEMGYDTIGFVANDFLIRRFGYGQGFQRYFEPRPHLDVFSATPILRKALRFLKKGKIKEPYFMYLHFMDVHGPFQCEGKDFPILADSPSYGESQILTKAQRRKIPSELGRNISWRGSEKSHEVMNWRNCYAAGIRKFDRRFGPFLDALRQMGELDDTVLVFTSDHGEELYDHKGWAHSHTLYSELLNVPLLIRLPKKQNAGRVVSETVSLVDIMPTLIAQAEPDLKIDGLAGRDIRPLFEGRQLDKSSWAYGTATRHDPGMISVQNNRYKIIWDYPNGTPQLYDIKKDPLERRNVAYRKPKVIQLFRREVIRHLNDLDRRGSLRESSTAVSGDLLERLQALGYLQ